MGLYRFHPDYQKHVIKGSEGDISFTSVWIKKGPKIWTSEPSKIHIVPQKQWTDFCCGAGVCSLFNRRFSNNGTDEVASSPAPPSPPSRHPLSFFPPLPSIFPVAFLLFYPAFSSFFDHLALIFLSSFPPWALSHLWFHPLHHPLHHLLPISLSYIVSAPHPPAPFLSFFPLSSLFFFSPAGNLRQLVCLAAHCTHARPNVETDTPPQGALDFVRPCCGTDLLTKVWGCLCASRQSAQSAKRVNFWWNLCRTFWVWPWWFNNHFIIIYILPMVVEAGGWLAPNPEESFPPQNVD